MAASPRVFISTGKRVRPVDAPYPPTPGDYQSCEQDRQAYRSPGETETSTLRVHAVEHLSSGCVYSSL